MPVTNRPVLIDRIEGGVDTTSPTHLVVPPQWLTAHNMRFNPRCSQVPRKKLYSTLSASQDILALPMIPGELPGYGRVLVLTKDQLRSLGGTVITGGLLADSSYRRWSYTLYNGKIFYTNDLNPIRYTDGSSDVALLNAPSARYVTTWYDHIVVASP